MVSRKIFSALAALFLLLFVGACAIEDADVASAEDEEEVGVVASPLSYLCSSQGYNENWVDPKNPGSGKHVVKYFYCGQLYTFPHATADWNYFGNATKWMVWQTSPTTFQVFIDGYYYWPYRWAGNSAAAVMNTVHLTN